MNTNELKKLFICLIGLFFLSYSGNAQFNLPFGKNKKKNVPNLEEWKSGIDNLISSEDCEGIMTYNWTVKTEVEIDPDDFEVADGEEYIPPNKTPNMGVFFLNDAPSNDFYTYWEKTGLALAKCGYFQHLLLQYKDLDYTADYRENQPNQPNHIRRKGTEDHLIKKLWMKILSELGNETVYRGFTQILENENLSKKAKSKCAFEIMQLYKWDYEWFETKHAESLFPYFNPNSQDWIIYMAQCEFDKDKLDPKLMESLNCNNYKVRVLAVNHLGKHAYKPAKEKIEYLQKNDPYFEMRDGVKIFPVRDEASEALSNMK